MARVIKKGFALTATVGRERSIDCRHTYTCLRLLEGADIYQISNNYRTSMEMTEKYYAAHWKTTARCAAISIMKPLPRKKTTPTKAPAEWKPFGWQTKRRSFLLACMMRLWPISRGRGEMADAADLSNLSAHRETDGVELLKVGET